MFGSPMEEQYINKISTSDAAARGKNKWPVLTVLIGGLFILIIWASLFEIEEVTKGIGRVIPSKQVQVVQTLEPGLVAAIEVNEGDIVDAGTVLMQIDDTTSSSKLGEVRQTIDALEAERARLEAEANLAGTIQFSAELKAKSAKAILAESAVFQSRKRQLAEELSVLNDRAAQRQGEIEELKASVNKTNAVIAPLRKEVTLTERLFRRGVVPEIDVLRLKSRIAELEGDLAINAATLPKLEASKREAENQIKAAQSAYVLNARERLAKLETELAVARETIRAASDRVERTALRAPARGIINKINVTTVGAVVQGGEDIIEIVPIDDGLLIEAEVRPQDIAFIKPGEKASVKLTAYDYLVYGALEGKVERIGADTIENKEGEEFFRVVVRTEQNFLGSAENKLPIIPGMVASVDIQTGQKTVMTYLMKPVLRAYGEALRER